MGSLANTQTPPAGHNGSAAYRDVVVETQALLAVLAGDHGAARQFVRDLLPGELHALSEAAGILAAFADTRTWCAGCGTPQLPGEGATLIGGLGGPRRYLCTGCDKGRNG